ncbi:nucleoside monophosphate kinase [Candidatus Falkowbacteria bacterium]|nr:nucleoside monophosphate kinase [Candidatus Falkowbacteria bacterium]
MQKKYFIVFGPPGSGKGTQVKLLAERLNLPAISTGDLLRTEIDRGTPIGLSVKALLAKGRLVSDEIVGELLLKRLRRKDTAAGVIFDGYPRRLSQQEFLLGHLSTKKPEPSIVPLLIDVSDEEVVRRISGRRACLCGAVYHVASKPPKEDGKCDRCAGKLFIRDDDKPSVVKSRLRTYHKESAKILSYWRKQGFLIEINGEQPIKKVDGELMRKLKKYI